MIISVGAIAANATLGITNFVANSDKLMERAVRIQKTFNNLSHQVAATGRTFTIVSVGGVLAAKNIGSAFIQTAADMEEYRVVMESVTKSTDEANRMMADLTVWAKQTPFDLGEVIASGTALTAVFKGNTDEVRRWLPALESLGALAKLRKIDFEQMTNQFIRLITQGAGAADLFRERSILSMLGIDADVDKDLVKLREKLFTTLTDVDGMFAGMSGKLSTTFWGVISQLIDHWTIFRKEIMEQTGMFDGLKQGLIDLKNLIDVNRDTIIAFAVENTALIEKVIIGTVAFLALGTAMTTLGFIIPPIVESLSLMSKTLLAVRASIAGVAIAIGATEAVAFPLATALMAAALAAGLLSYALRANGIELEDQYKGIMKLHPQLRLVSWTMENWGWITAEVTRFIRGLAVEFLYLWRAIVPVVGLMQYLPAIGDDIKAAIPGALDQVNSAISKLEDKLYATPEELAAQSKSKFDGLGKALADGASNFFAGQGQKIIEQIKTDAITAWGWVTDKFPVLKNLKVEIPEVEPVDWNEKLGMPNFEIPAAMEKATKQGVDKAAKELERLKEEGERVWRELFPVEGAKFDIGKDITALSAAGKNSPESMKAMQRDLADGWRGSYDELVQLEQQLIATGGAAATVGMGLTEVWTEFQTELDSVNIVNRQALEEFARWSYETDQFKERLSQLDFIAQQLGTNLATEDTTRALEDLMSTLGVDTLEEINRLDKAIGDLRPEFKSVFQNARKDLKDVKVEEFTDQFFRLTGAVSGLGPKFKLMAQVAETSFKIIRAAQAAASLGFTEILNLVIEIIAAMGILGGDSEKSMSDMDKFMDDLASTAEEVADRMTDAIVQFARTGKAEIGDLADFILEEFLRAGISNLIVNPAVDFVGDMFFAKGGAFWGGNLIPAAKGHVTSGPELFRFKSGQMGVRGEAGNEAILPLARINGVLGVKSTGGNAPIVNIYNNALPPEAITVNSYQADGREVVDIVLNIVKTGLMDGSLSGALKVAR